jgi:hypothetical protein
MPTGTVKWYNDQKGYGFIQQTAAARTYSSTQQHSNGPVCVASLKARRFHTMWRRTAAAAKNPLRT